MKESPEPNNPTCNGCGFTANAYDFNPAMSPYHDFMCPKCRTTSVDTSAINRNWKARGEVYGYGDNNCLKMS